MPTKIIDLTQPLSEKTTVYPGSAQPSFEPTSTVEKDGYREHQLSMLSHTGTHIDAPAHVLHSGRFLDQFPMEKFIGSARVIDCRNRNEISLEFLQTFEYEITNVDFVLFYTGWQHRWNTVRYFGDCPVPTTEAAHYLAGFNLKGIGVDAFSLDKIISANKAPSEIIPNHHILLGKEILLIENLTNLDKLPETDFTFQCFPLNVENADGSPVRAIAMIDH